MRWQDAVLDFWFGLAPERWWKTDPALDAAIRRRFLPLWREQRENLPERFLDSPEEALAAAILFDQFPRNMFRGEAGAFSTDPLARAMARGAVDRGLDRDLPAERRPFLYMPFEHSEDLDDQNRSLLLFAALGDDYHLGFAQKHHDVIARFGRFPHRNAMLGRAPRPDEVAAGEVVPW
ncbi:MAG: hypothetical protein QOG84_15 [Sphingomonadales bacterium]|jgi:uncharacterized protein (DUF924 family)|nr:hypothetical protein [Sphingomonadales bacterium]